jgi:hypothetical protein
MLNWVLYNVLLEEWKYRERERERREKKQFIVVYGVLYVVFDRILGIF